MPGQVPVLIVSGTVGAGKTATSFAVSALLNERGTPHFLTDLDYLTLTYPRPDDDPWGDRIMATNLASIWPNARDAGATCAVLARVIVQRTELVPIQRAIPGADITVVRLTAPQSLIQERLTAREAGERRSWSHARSPELDADLDRHDAADVIVRNDGRPINDVAAEVLASWEARISVTNR
jgi:adenylylsulfate kinase